MTLEISFVGKEADQHQIEANDGLDLWLGYLMQQH